MRDTAVKRYFLKMRVLEYSMIDVYIYAVGASRMSSEDGRQIEMNLY